MIAVPRAHRRPRWLWPIALVASGMWTCFPRTAVAQEPVSFPTEDGGLIRSDLYGKGDRAVLLAHGGRFNKESWTEQAGALSAAGFRVLAIDFRGYGRSTGPGDADPLSAPLRLDILAGVRYPGRPARPPSRWLGAAWEGPPRRMPRSRQDRGCLMLW